MRQLCRVTTHTPLEAGHDCFAYELVRRLFLGDPPDSENAVIDMEELRRLGGLEHLNMTQLALSLSDFVDGVVQR